MESNDPFHVDGELCSSEFANERQFIIDAIREVDSRLSGSLGPDWIISSWELNGEALYMAHCVRTQWSSSARSPQQLAQHIRERWPA